MSEVKWIKLSTSMFEDEKIRLIESMPEADTLLIIWIRLLAQAGKTNASGYIFLSKNIPYSDEMLATLFNRPIATVRLALQTFQQFGMIEITDDQYICISNWEKHQNVDGLERVKQLNAERNRKYRERKKQQQLSLENKENESDVSVTSRDGTDIEEDKELEKDKELEIINTSSSIESDTKVPIPYQEILEYLNKKAEKNFNHKAESHRKLIRARLNEGYTVENFKTVIDNKVSQWLGKFDREGKPLNQYLRPSTLFAQKHFDNYLNETVSKSQSNQQQYGNHIDIPGFKGNMPF
ncbi:phage replisome organizer N-terminal domain-containing protein [Bacillus thuringiensis]|nr:phage replisome organizer N-terminal domain-containing protein [Bacillus thuringiensis]MED2759090.1 phage replisome organizer N-terminal domain-containing protein [Bacillus thuringiensis]MED2771293.1 phage replisome organizer N-terminal domain-containing protein [Bacillus thuringiensis]MED2777843.1 phage replisome organizer N-terminal domain-containing protein [Bacillus thuringiensis]MED2780048.1 phage replisome organizer N-terminal domain-containing protein [Bacillus thuringiensis]